MKTLLKAVGYLLLALVVLIAGYLFVFSRSFHIPVNLYAPAAYVPPGGPIIVFGGNRATGLEIVKLLRDKGEDVTVAVRPTSDTAALQTIGAKTVIADALDAEAVRAAFASGSYRVVVSTLGTARGEQAKRPISSATATSSTLHRRRVRPASCSSPSSAPATPPPPRRCRHAWR